MRWLTRYALLVICVLLVSGLFAQQPATLPQTITMQEAVTIALKCNPTLVQAAGRTAETVANVGIARAAEGFQLNLNTQYSITSVLPSFRASPLAPVVQLANPSVLINTLTAQQVVYSGGRLQALVRQATDLAHASAATEQRNQQQVIYQTERTYLMLAAAQQERGVAQQTLDAAEAHLHDAQVRYEARTAARYDVLRAQVEVESGRQQVISASADIRFAQDALKQAMGVEQGEYTADGVTLPSAANLPPVDNFLNLAYKNRPELCACQFQISAANELIRATRAARSPTISLFTNYELFTPESITQVSGWTAGVQMQLPILDAGLIHYRIKAAEAQRVQVVAACNEIRVQVTAEVNDAYTRFEAAARQVDVATDKVALAEEALRISTIRYRGGVATATELADAQQALATARQQLVLAQASYAIARAELDFATGATAPPTPPAGAPR